MQRHSSYTQTRTALFGAVLLILSYLGGVSPLQAQTLTPANVGCSLPATLTKGSTWYVDPVNGSMSNDGSAAHPWHTLAEVVSAGLISSRRYTLPYKTGAHLVAQHPDGVVKPGDTIVLLSGNHGAVNLDGYVNSTFITVTAAEASNPVLSKLYVGGSSKWIFRGLTIQSNSTSAHMCLVNFAKDTFGPTTDICFAENSVLSPAEESETRQGDWQSKMAYLGVSVDKGTSAITIVSNSISNVRWGMILSGSKIIAATNSINNCLCNGIGVDVSGRAVTLCRNTVMKEQEIGNGKNGTGLCFRQP